MNFASQHNFLLFYIYKWYGKNGSNKLNILLFLSKINPVSKIKLYKKIYTVNIYQKISKNVI